VRASRNREDAMPKSCLGATGAVKSVGYTSLTRADSPEEDHWLPVKVSFKSWSGLVLKSPTDPAGMPRDQRETAV